MGLGLVHHPSPTSYNPTPTKMPPRRLATHMLHPVLKKTSSNLTLETLPSDVIMEILSSYNNFGDLRALIGSSAVFYRHFREYPSSIITQVAKNIIGRDGWEDATAVLVYQRNAEIICLNPTAVREELGGQFTLQPKDIPQLVANQRYFDCCCECFSTFVCKNYPRPTEDSHVPLAPTTRTNPPISPSFTAGDTLPIKLFYRMWRLSLRFTFDSLTTFAGREQQLPLADLWVVSRIMFLSTSGIKSMSGLARWTHFMPSETSARRLIDIWGRQRKLADLVRGKKLSDLIRMKAMLCLRIRVRSSRYRAAEQKLGKDYRRYQRGEITFRALIKLYDLEIK